MCASGGLTKNNQMFVCNGLLQEEGFGMNARIQFCCWLIMCVCSVADIQLRPNMRFMDNDTLVVVDDNEDDDLPTIFDSNGNPLLVKGRLEVFNAKENECLYYSDLPRDGVCNTSPYCELYCSPDEISIISKTRYNALWKFDFEKVRLVSDFSTDGLSNKYNAGVVLYSSPNGEHIISIGRYEPNGKSIYKEDSYSKVICSKNIHWALRDLNIIDWHDVYDVEISNDGKTLLVLSNKHEPILIKERGRDRYGVPINATELVQKDHYHYTNKQNRNLVLLSLSLCNKKHSEKTEAKLSPRGSYVIFPTDEFLAVMSTETPKKDFVIRQRKDGTLAIFLWNVGMEQFTYFPSPEKCESAFKWCAFHIRYDTCADRLDYMGTLFSHINVLFAEFSEDESHLLLITKETGDRGFYLIDLSSKDLDFINFGQDTKIYAAAISQDGSMVALSDQNGQLMIKDLSDFH